MPKKKRVKQPVREKKKCCDCGEPTTDYYPLKGGKVRCSDCQERDIRGGFRDASPTDRSYQDLRR